MHKIYKWFILSFTFTWTHSAAPRLPFRISRVANCGLVVSPRNQFCLLHPEIVSPDEDRRDTSQKYYIGYRYVAQSDKGPERVPLTRSFLVAMESRPAFIFTAKYFDDSTARRTFSSEDEIVVVAVVLIRSLLSEREGILKMIATTRNSSGVPGVRK